MNKIPRRIMATVITIALLSPVIVQAGPASHPLSENAALSLLLRTLKTEKSHAKTRSATLRAAMRAWRKGAKV
jgi:hypothetical protein